MQKLADGAGFGWPTGWLLAAGRLADQRVNAQAGVKAGGLAEGTSTETFSKLAKRVFLCGHPSAAGAVDWELSERTNQIWGVGPWEQFISLETIARFQVECRLYATHGC